jgi:hypothetical protein
VLGNALGAVDLPGSFRDTTEDLCVVELLPRLTSAKHARYLADEEDHR